MMGWMIGLGILVFIGFLGWAVASAGSDPAATTPWGSLITTGVTTVFLVVFLSWFLSQVPIWKADRRAGKGPFAPAEVVAQKAATEAATRAAAEAIRNPKIQVSLYDATITWKKNGTEQNKQALIFGKDGKSFVCSGDYDSDRGLCRAYSTRMTTDTTDLATNYRYFEFEVVGGTRTVVGTIRFQKSHSASKTTTPDFVGAKLWGHTKEDPDVPTPESQKDSCEGNLVFKGYVRRHIACIPPLVLQQLRE